MGYCGKYDKKAFADGFYKTVSRGPDMSRCEQVGDGVFGFHRLAILGPTGKGFTKPLPENLFIVFPAVSHYSAHIITLYSTS